MTPAPVPADEADRLNALRDLLLLDTPPEEDFDRLTRLAARLTGRIIQNGRKAAIV